MFLIRRNRKWQKPGAKCSLHGQRSRSALSSMNSVNDSGKDLLNLVRINTTTTSLFKHDQLEGIPIYFRVHSFAEKKARTISSEVLPSSRLKCFHSSVCKTVQKLPSLVSLVIYSSICLRNGWLLEMNASFKRRKTFFLFRVLTK